jgi:hypothetical protein
MILCLVFSIIGIHPVLLPISATPNNWSIGADMPTPRSEAAYASLGTKIYVIGGRGQYKSREQKNCRSL